MEMTREKLLEIIKLGLTEKKWSWLKLATESDVTYDNINNFKRGSADILKGNNLIKVLRTLGELEEIAKLEKQIPKVKIMQYIDDNGYLVPFKAGAAEEAACPPEWDAEDIVAIRIVNNWLHQFVQPGAIIFYSKSNKSNEKLPPMGLGKVNYVTTDDRPYSKYIGKPCIAEFNNRLILAVLYNGSSSHLYNLGTYSLPAVHKDVDITNIYEIIYIKTA